MFCSNCGIENAEGSAFCKNCGKPLSQITPDYSAPAYTPAAKPPLSSNPVLNAVKKIAGSPLFLVAVIAYSLQILATLVSSVGTGAKVEMFLYSLLDEIGYAAPFEFYEIVDAISRIGDIPYIIGTIIGLIPTILICVGLWITYSSAKNRMTDTMKTSGLTMIKVITIIQLVWACVVFALVELLLMLIVVAVAAANVYEAGLIIAGVVFVVLFVAAAFALAIVYFAKIIKSIGVAKKTITTGIPSDKVSSYVAVWAFISAVCLVFSLITSFIASAASMTAFICFGILIFKYKSAMKGLMFAQPVQ